MSRNDSFSLAFSNFSILSLIAKGFWFVAFKVMLEHVFLLVNSSVHPHNPATLCSCNYKLNNNLIFKYLNLIFTFHIGQYILEAAIF